MLFGTGPEVKLTKSHPAALKALIIAGTQKQTRQEK